MLYKFRSKAAGDVIMTAPVGDAVLRAMEREPASKGIFESSALPGLIGTLEAAVAEDEARRQQVADDARSDGGSGAKPDSVSLRQRAWPLLEMMKRAAGAGQDIVWGV